MLGHDDGHVSADALHLIEKPRFAEVGIQDMDKQAVLTSDGRLELGCYVHAVGPDGYQHHVLAEIDGRFLQQGVLAGRGRVRLGDRSLRDFAKEGLNEELEFRNPNVAGECGCGESFTV